MFKKILIAGVAVVVGLMVVRHTQVGSHLKAFWKDGKNFVANAIPIENEIERMRGDIARLDDLYKTQLQPYAVELVVVENLRKEIAEIEKKLETEKSNIDTMKNDLKTGAAKITYCDVTYPRARVEKDLDRRFSSYLTCEKGLDAKKDLLAAKEEKLGYAKNKLETMKTSRFLMDADLARLEAEYEGVKNAQATSELQLDDSEFSRIKTSMAQLQQRIQVEKKKCELAGSFFGNPVKVSLQKAEKRDLLKEIEAHFSKSDIPVESKVASTKSAQ